VPPAIHHSDRFGARSADSKSTSLIEFILTRNSQGTSRDHRELILREPLATNGHDE